MKNERVNNLTKYINISEMLIGYFNNLSAAYSHCCLDRSRYENLSKEEMLFLVKSIISFNRNVSKKYTFTGNLNPCITSNYSEYKHAIKTIKKVLRSYDPNELMLLLFNSKQIEVTLYKINQYEVFTSYDKLLNELFDANNLLIRFFTYGAREIIMRRQFQYKNRLNILKSI